MCDFRNIDLARFLFCFIFIGFFMSHVRCDSVSEATYFSREMQTHLCAASQRGLRREIY